MAAENIRERARAERAGIAFVDRPGREQHVEIVLDHDRIVSEPESRPFPRNALGSKIGIPSQPAISVKIRHGQRVAQPVGVYADIYNANESARRAMKSLACHNILHRCGILARVHIEIESFFPHGRKKTQMPLLARVFLRDLQLDGLHLFSRGRRRAVTPARAPENQ